MTGPRQDILESWDSNAEAWTRAVREQRIESRRVATDAAIVAAVLSRRPRRVLDVGCGEGWLCRALAAEGLDVVGLDASGALVDAAIALGTPDVHHLGYSALAEGDSGLGQFDAIVCNFALLADDLVPLLSALRDHLSPGGRLFVQTVHPWATVGDGAYEDGWRLETFAAFGGEFAAPMPWYFRTLSSWVGVLEDCGLRVERIEEPAHPQTQRPLSLLLTARVQPGASSHAS
jgi:2-polyprenyl-3-methyl-5-hydroxy-6-metoxy-1,4-benzoquinol methylase